MSFVSPGPGDIHYSQYAVVDTYPIKDAVSIVKGNCYTMNADGHLIAFTAGSGAVTNLNGVFQAMADSAAVSGEAAGSRRVQCLVKRSRICMKAPADVTPGDRVAIAASGSTVTADTVQVATSQIIGTVFEILALSNRRPKAKTAAGDLILVDVLE